jgi:hypothetical protein
MARTTKTKFLTLAGLVALLCVLCTPAARADGLTITLPAITGNAGDTITVLGALTNNGSDPLYFSSDTPNIADPTGAIGALPNLAFNAFFGLGPSFIDGNATLSGVDLFTIFIAADAAPGVYAANLYNIAGGSDPACAVGTCDTLLGTVAFDVTVQNPIGVPEPGTLTLLASVLLALAALRRF